LHEDKSYHEEMSEGIFLMIMMTVFRLWLNGVRIKGSPIIPLLARNGYHDKESSRRYRRDGRHLPSGE